MPVAHLLVLTWYDVRDPDDRRGSVPGHAVSSSLDARWSGARKGRKWFSFDEDRADRAWCLRVTYALNLQRVIPIEFLDQGSGRPVRPKSEQIWVDLDAVPRSCAE